uniref:Uncharacterized protein n=1 Tax=Sphenodon punctatus TaxID=8508 RepID=A0A8D0H3T5_SPHPU
FLRNEDNDIPLYLKGGTLDVMLYYFTMGLTTIGTCYAIYELVRTHKK